MVPFISWMDVRKLKKEIKNYNCFRYESVHDGKAISISTKIWFKTLHAVAACKPIMHSFQGALPHLPLPSLKFTLEKV
jgi:hypothetical protein